MIEAEIEILEDKESDFTEEEEIEAALRLALSDLAVLFSIILSIP